MPDYLQIAISNSISFLVGVGAGPLVEWSKDYLYKRRSEEAKKRRR